MRFSKTNKPPLGSKINWAHPFVERACGCWLMNEGSEDKVYESTENRYTGLTINSVPRSPMDCYSVVF